MKRLSSKPEESMTLEALQSLLEAEGVSASQEDISSFLQGVGITADQVRADFLDVVIQDLTRVLGQKSEIVRPKPKAQALTGDRKQSKKQQQFVNKYGQEVAKAIMQEGLGVFDTAVEELTKNPHLQAPSSRVDIIAGLYRLMLPWHEQKGESIDPLEAYAKAQKGARGYEWQYADALARELSGKREVPVPTGVIDILTEDELIEVKHVSAWKHAVGQLHMYGLYYPLHQKRIHLFGFAESARLASIVKWCKQAAINTTWEK